MTEQKKPMWQWDDEDLKELAATDLPRLTAKQLKFVKQYQKQNFTKPSDAYVKAFKYNGEFPDDVVGRLLHENPNVNLYINIIKARDLVRVQTGSTDIVKILLQMSVDPNISDTARATALKELRQWLQPVNLWNSVLSEGSTDLTINISRKVPDQAGSAVSPVEPNTQKDGSNSDSQSN